MMKKIYTLAIVLLVLGVSSCKLGKHYSRPELRLPEQIEGTVPDSVSAGDIRWTDLYTDPVLRQLIRKTLEGNKDLMIAAAKVKESMELRRIAKADLFPKAEATVSAEREYDETPGNTFEGKVLASWEVDLWGKLRWAGQAALAEYLQSVEGRQALQSALVAQVAQAYFELIALDQELAIVRQTLAARQEGVRLAKLRFEGGLTSENPLRQAQVELARTQTLVPGLEREIRLKENQITLLAGEYPGEVARGKSIGQQQLMTALPVGLSSRILERRPDIRQAEYRLKAAHAKVGVAYTSMFP
ncbi:TolC family protein, partial [Odoribacter splanchnicus]|nr:TolC family protein [Odoribacter splanchnicus]